MVRSILAMALAALAGCNAHERRTPAFPAAGEPRPAEAAPSPIAAPVTAAGPRPVLLAEGLVLAEWSKADNRARCAPLAFAADGGIGGTARRASFSGGWSVAFDLPRRRSAYGLAGTGHLPEDSAGNAAGRRDALLRQWPYFRDLPGLPEPSFAGYGVEGAQAYPDGDPRGLQVNSLAYVRVGGQACLYHVWSRLGRAHLERLLDNLRMIGTMAQARPR